MDKQNRIQVKYSIFKIYMTDQLHSSSFSHLIQSWTIFRAEFVHWFLFLWAFPQEGSVNELQGKRNMW